MWIQIYMNHERSCSWASHKWASILLVRLDLFSSKTSQVSWSGLDHTTTKMNHGEIGCLKNDTIYTENEICAWNVHDCLSWPVMRFSLINDDIFMHGQQRKHACMWYKNCILHPDFTINVKVLINKYFL